MRLPIRRRLPYHTAILAEELIIALAQDPLTTVVSTKRQVILPKGIRDALHWAAGTRLVVESTGDGVLLKTSPAFAATTMDEVFGSLAYEGPVLSVEAMDAAI